MNKLLVLVPSPGKRLREGRPSSTYQPITQTQVRLPPDFPVCSDQDIASRQISSMFAHVFSEPYTEEVAAVAQAASERLAASPDPDRLDKAATEFSKLRG